MNRAALGLGSLCLQESETGGTLKSCKKMWQQPGKRGVQGERVCVLS